MNWRGTFRTALRAAEVLALLSLCVLLIAATALLVQMRRDEHQVAISTLELEGKATATMADVRRVVLSLGGTAAEVRKTSITTRAIAMEEQRQIQREMAELIRVTRDSDASVRSMRAFLDDTNLRMNDELLPQAAATLQALTADGRKLNGNLKSLKTVEDNLAVATAGFATLTNDPHILHAIAQGDGAVSKVNEGLELVVRKERQMMKPGNFAWHIFKTLLHPAADGAQIYQAVH